MAMKKTLPTLVFLCFIFALSGQTILWEETFDGGIPDSWTIGPGQPEGAVWQWSESGRAEKALLDGVPTQALFYEDRPAIASPTAANGCAMYNSDVYDSGGIQFGGGPFPGGHAGSLTSPVIDLPNLTGVGLRFHQYARLGQAGSTFVEISIDEGASWDTIIVNEQFAPNQDLPIDDEVFLNLSEIVAGQPSVQLRFSWNGRYFFWLLDDVQLFELPAYDLSISTYFRSPEAYSSDFYSIQDSLSFYADITNNGADTLQGVQLKLLLAEQTETFILFEESTALDTLLPGATKRLRIPEKWRVSYDYKNYVVKYEVVDVYHEQADANPLDNSATYHFNLRETGGFFEPKAQKDDCEGFDVVGTEDLPEWQIGTVYYQPDDFSRILYTVEFSVATQSEEESLNDFTGINLVVYEMEDSNFYENWSINSISSFVEQAEVVGFNSFDFPVGASSFDLFKVDVLNAVNLEPGIMLEEGKSYLVSIVFEGAEANLLQVVDTSQVYPQVANMVGFEEKWYLNPFGNNVSPVIRLGEGCNFTTEVQEPQDVGRLWLSPNPTNDVVRLNWEEMTSGELQLNIWSADGRQVLAAKHVTSDGGIEIDVSHLPKGIYHVRASAEDMAYTGKLVIK